MIERTKKGFSLVEVMLLFTVLAVFMAASLPTITKRARAIPKKISHGVYRCVQEPTGNGGFELREYLYSGSRSLYPGGYRVAQNGRCSFNVPSAAMYKVDLYSAGAGGTKYLNVKSQQNDDRTAKMAVPVAVLLTLSI